MERVNSYISANYDVSENVEVFVDAVVSNNESFGRYAPPAAPRTMLASNPKNPYGVDV